jgi:hypothetical protein
MAARSFPQGDRPCFARWMGNRYGLFFNGFLGGGYVQGPRATLIAHVVCPAPMRGRKQLAV